MTVNEYIQAGNPSCLLFGAIYCMAPELAREIEKIRLETGLNTVELLQSLREERAKYVQSSPLS